MSEVKTKYGQCEYSFEKDCFGKYVHIYNLFVEPEYRNQKKATELLQKAIANIRNTGYKGEIKIVANPKEKNINIEKLKGFYMRMGLKVYDVYLEAK